LYSVLVTIDAPNDQHAQTSQILLTKGLLGLCDGDEGFLHGLAFLGVASSVTSSKTELIELARDVDIDIDVICRKAGAIKGAFGLATVIDQDDQILAII
jgi:hypothetical protein